MNVMQQSFPYLPYGTVLGPRDHIVGLLLVFTYILQEDLAKILYVPGAPRSVNLARK